jgi:uncharacterized membrane protein YjjP (DUF1212 family)
VDNLLNEVQKKLQYIKELRLVWKVALSMYGMAAIVMCVMMGMWGIFLVYVSSMSIIMAMSIINRARFITYQEIQENLELYPSTKPLPKFELPHELSQPLNNLILETS